MLEVSVIAASSTRSYCASALEITSITGNRVLLKGHAPALYLVEKESVAIVHFPDGKKEHITFKRGIIEAQRTRVRLLIDE